MIVLIEDFMLEDVYIRIVRYIDSGYDFSLSDNVGLCVLYANRYRQTEDLDFFEIFKKTINKIVEIAEYTQGDGPNGVSSVLWLLKYLKSIELLCFSKKQIHSLQKVSIEGFEYSLSINNWGYYYNGAIGYLLAMKSLRCYEQYLNFILRSIEKDACGHYSLLSLNYNKSTNLGLHAGVLGVLYVTNKLLKQGLFDGKCLEIQKILLDIIFRKMEDTNFKFYPAVENYNAPGRMCWTYGELSLAVQLLVTGITVNDSFLKEKAIEIAMKTSARQALEDTMVCDSCFISGSSGNYFLYKLLNAHSPHEIFLNSGELWLNHTFNILQQLECFNLDRHTQRRVADFSILGGLSGVCLSVDEFDDSLWQEYVLLDLF